MPSHSFRAPRHQATAALSLALAALTSLAGCGSDEFRLKVYPAGGTVLAGGKPVADALVRFHPVDPATVKIPEGQAGYPIANPTTETAADGSFQLSSYLANDGVPSGEYKVTVLVGAGNPGDDDSGEEANPDAQKPRTKGPKLAAASKYRDPANTPLKATIKPGLENRFTFELN
ncbi:carboxypeptidase-like regulatory domain-containing protein [Isosphaeraceae bacterium EP7]